MMPPMILALAPMQDVTDAAFMRVLARVGSLPDFFVTPYFRSTRTTCAMSEEPLRCIRENTTGVPIWAQLAGSEPQALLRDARELLRLPIAGINLNAGCPSPLVNRHGAGAGLLRELPRLREVCMALRELLPPGQFSIKCRLGWADAAEFPAILEILREAQPDLLMVHARTRRELYGGAPHRQAVHMAVQHMPCPVLANGDIDTPAAAAEWVGSTRAAGVMIGRGAVRQPYIFRMLRGGSPPTPQEMAEYFDILLEEIAASLKKYTPAGHCNRMKKYLAFCYGYFAPETEYALRRCTCVEEMRRLLHEGFTFQVRGTRLRVSLRSLATPWQAK